MLIEVMGVSVYLNAVVNVFISGNHHSTKISVFKNKENYFKNIRRFNLMPLAK